MLSPNPNPHTRVTQAANHPHMLASFATLCRLSSAAVGTLCLHARTFAGQAWHPSLGVASGWARLQRSAARSPPSAAAAGSAGSAEGSGGCRWRSLFAFLRTGLSSRLFGMWKRIWAGKVSRVDIAEFHGADRCLLPGGVITQLHAHGVGFSQLVRPKLTLDPQFVRR